MNPEDLKAGAFYWVAWSDGELDVGECTEYKDLMVTGMHDPVCIGPSGIERVISEIEKPEVG